MDVGRVEGSKDAIELSDVSIGTSVYGVGRWFGSDTTGDTTCEVRNKDNALESTERNSDSRVQVATQLFFEVQPFDIAKNEYFQQTLRILSNFDVQFP